MAGLAFPPGVIFPDNPGVGGLDALAEYEQCAYLWAGGITGVAPAPVPTPAAPARPDSYLWQIPKGSRRAYARGIGVFPALRSRGTLVQTGVEHFAYGVCGLPLLASRGFLEAFDAPSPIAMHGVAQFPVLASVGYGRAESEDDEIMTMLAAYLVSRP